MLPEERCQRASITACYLAASPLKSTTGGTAGFTPSFQADEAIICTTSRRTGGPQVESYHALAGPVFGFLQRMTFENKLHTVHQATAVGALCLGRGGWLAQQAHVLDALLEFVVDHFVLPIDQGRDLLAVPTEPALLAIRTRLQVKAQARGVGLALDRVQAPTFAAKAHPPCLAHTDPIG